MCRHKYIYVTLSPFNINHQMHTKLLEIDTILLRVRAFCAFFSDNFSLRHAARRGNWRRRIQFRKEKWRPVSSSRRLSYLSVSNCNGIRACAFSASDLYQLSIGSFSASTYVRTGVTDAGSEINVVVNGLTRALPSAALRD